jgi:diguanylate cyclase (GGDEF)-like protein/PAS domain S-box-containing protein
MLKPSLMSKKTPIKVDISLILIAIIGLGLSLTAFFYVQKWEFSLAIEDQKKQANEHARILRQTFITYGQILKSIRGLYHVHHVITRQNFAQFVKPDILEQPGLHALQWVLFIPPTERQMAEAKVHAEGIPNFHIWEFSAHGQKQEVGIREAYYPVMFAEPRPENQDILGYDAGEHKILQTALEKARDLGQLTTSGMVLIQTAMGQKRGVQAFLPIYHTQNIPITVAERQRQLVGFVVGIFLLDEIAEKVLRLPEAKLRTEFFLQIFDETKELNSTSQLLYAPKWFNKKVAATSTEIWNSTLEFGGRLWRLSHSKTTSNTLLQSGYAWAVLGIGLLFSLGLLRYMYIILTRAQWAEELVTKRTQSLKEANHALNKEIENRERMTVALEANRQRFQAIFNEAAIGIALIDLKDKILDCNRALQSLLRYRETELNNKFLSELTHPEDINKEQWMLEKMLAGKYDTYRVGKRYICKNGAIVWTNQSCSIVRDTSHPFIISMIEDITERKRAEEARLEAEKKYRDIFENAIEGIFQCTPSGRYLSVNPAFVRIFDYESAEQVYNEITDIGQHLYVDTQRRAEFLVLLNNHSNVQDFEYQARCRNGQIIWVNETVRVVRDSEGQIRYYEGIVEDVTERKLTEERLRHDATHDQLTGLFNRAAFTTRLTQALAQVKSERLSQQLRLQKNPELALSSFPKNPAIPFAVLFVDLDRFKMVNDTMGHLVGDQLLTEIAHRLDAHKFAEDDVVARFGGDEFALMLKNLPDSESLEQKVEKIQQQLSQPYIINNETFNTTASIGIALSKPEYKSADELLRDADTAMYEAKKQGRGKSLIFKTDMRIHVINIVKMERDLRKALEREEFRLYYQPIISLENRHTVGLEALIRWIHPERGFVSPDEFIPLAEETGLIKEIGLWVFETACIQLQRWQAQFAHHANLGMNINVSPIQLKQPRLVRHIQDILEKTGIKGPTCRVEITESAMMQDPESALGIFNELKNLEVLLYVDDFGTGYSSLNYLQKFPIDALKIDKSFINEIDNSLQAAQIAHAIIALGEAFGLRIVAEGVETNLQLAMLKAANCHHVQGYYFSKPKDAQSIEEFLSIETHNLARTAIN